MNRLFSDLPPQPSSKFEYDAFISYRTGIIPDALVGEELQKVLESYPVPRSLKHQIVQSSKFRNRLKVFRDTTDLSAGANLGEAIKERLRVSRWLVVICSPDTPRSTYCTDEVRYFEEYHGASHVLLLLIVGEPHQSFPSSASRAGAASPGLQDNNHTGNEPLAADIRASDTKSIIAKLRGHGIPKAKQARFKILAPLLGCASPDVLIQRHRERVRRLRLQLTLVVLAAALGFGWIIGEQWYFRKVDDAVKQLEIAGNELPSLSKLNITERCENSVERFRQLRRDPILALHYCLASAVRSLDATPLADLNGLVSYLRVSEDKDLILVGYDHQNYGGSPDLEDIPDSTAVALYKVSTKTWIIKHPLSSPIGSALYGKEPSQVVGIEAPYYLITRAGGEESPDNYERFSLMDGKTTKCEASVGSRYFRRLMQSQSEDYPVGKPGEQLKISLKSENLFVTDPQDGIDIQYGPRMVDKSFAASPDSTTALVGTYEGRLRLFDMATGLLRGEIKLKPIYALAYQADGGVAYACDSQKLWKIQIAGRRGIHEFSKTLAKGDALPRENVLGISLSDHDRLLAVVTTHRMMCLFIEEGRWIEWVLPQKIEKIAAFKVDWKRKAIDLVITDGGTILSGYFQEPSVGLVVLAEQDQGKPVVAWLDEGSGTAWESLSKPEGNVVRVKAVPLSRTKSQPVELALPLWDSPHKADDSDEVHSVARIGDSLVVFHGDREAIADHEIKDEEMIEKSLGWYRKQSRHIVFRPNVMVDNLGEGHWDCRQICKILPGSRQGFVLGAGKEDGSDVVFIGADGSLQERGGSLCARDYMDWRERYILSLDSSDTGVGLTVKHLRTSHTLQYQLPWRFQGQPKFAGISENGRTIAVASATGDFMFADVSEFDQKH